MPDSVSDAKRDLEAVACTIQTFPKALEKVRELAAPQAIEEGFILDVLRNYTPSKLAFRLATGGKALDEQEVERVVAVEPDPKATQAHLSAAVEPVADRLVKRYKAERESLRVAKAKQDAAAEQAAQDEINALVLFKRNLGAFLRVYTFLSWSPRSSSSRRRTTPRSSSPAPPIWIRRCSTPSWTPLPPIT